MSLSPLTFTGVSQFSSDFQTILDRAVKIAQLPVTAMQNQQKDMLQKKMLASGLEGALASLSSSLANLAELGDQQGMKTTSSNTSAVRVISTTGTVATSYKITNLTSVAAAAAETSVSGYADSGSTAVSTTGQMKLYVGSESYDIDLTGKNNLAGLRDAINQKLAGLTATILTTGTGTNPNYLSVTANASGATTLRLVDDPTGAATEVLTSANQGSNAEFDLNGVHVSKSTNIINDVVSGLSFEVVAASSSAVTLTTATNKESLATGLEDLASAYNEVRGLVNNQIGESAGLLTGDLMVRESLSVLGQLSGFEGLGTMKRLAEVGVEFDKEGNMSLNRDTFNALSATQISAGLTLVDSDHLGGVQGKVDSLCDPVTGMAKIEQESYDKQSKYLSDQIASANERIELMRQGMLARLQLADTLLAKLESQQSMLTENLKSLDSLLTGSSSN